MEISLIRNTGYIGDWDWKREEEMLLMLVPLHSLRAERTRSRRAKTVTDDGKARRDWWLESGGDLRNRQRSEERRKSGYKCISRRFGVCLCATNDSATLAKEREEKSKIGRWCWWEVSRVNGDQTKKLARVSQQYRIDQSTLTVCLLVVRTAQWDDGEWMRDKGMKRPIVRATRHMNTCTQTHARGRTRDVAATDGGWPSSVKRIRRGEGAACLERLLQQAAMGQRSSQGKKRYCSGGHVCLFAYNEKERRGFTPSCLCGPIWIWSFAFRISTVSWIRLSFDSKDHFLVDSDFQ